MRRFNKEFKESLENLVFEVGLDHLGEDNLVVASIRELIDILHLDYESLETKINVEWKEVITIGSGKSVSTYTYTGEFNRFLKEYKTLDRFATLKIIQCVITYTTNQYGYKGEATFKFTTGNENGNYSKFILKVYDD